MNDDWNLVAQHYAAQRGVTLAERLGSGIHGIVFIAVINFEGGFGFFIHRFSRFSQMEREDKIGRGL